MSENIRITVLVENSVHRQGLAAEHGLSFHIQMRSHSILFDTGQTELVLSNAKALGIELAALDAVVLSHGHYDHTGGVPAVLDAAPKARVYVHPAALGSKFSIRSPGSARFIGMSQATVGMLQNRGCIKTTGWTELLKGVFVTGEIPRETQYEDTGGPFFLDDLGTLPDPIADDQALVIDLGASLILLLGCAHAGVVNTLNRVAHLTDGKPLSAVIGGFHLGAASEERIQKTILRLREEKLDCLAPVHCTGWPATARLWQELPQEFRAISVGTIVKF